MRLSFKSRGARIAIVLSVAYLLVVGTGLYVLAEHLSSVQRSDFIAKVCSSPESMTFDQCIALADQMYATQQKQILAFVATRSLATLAILWLIGLAVRFSIRWIRKGER
jgi:hypothetical protein